MLDAAMPAIVFLKEENILRSTTRAINAVRPTLLSQIFAAASRIGEENNRILECLQRFHISRMRLLVYFVKYIIAISGWRVIQARGVNAR